MQLEGVRDNIAGILHSKAWLAALGAVLAIAGYILLKRHGANVTSSADTSSDALTADYSTLPGPTNQPFFPNNYVDTTTPGDGAHDGQTAGSPSFPGGTTPTIPIGKPVINQGATTPTSTSTTPGSSGPSTSTALPVVQGSPQQPVTGVLVQGGKVVGTINNVGNIPTPLRGGVVFT